MAFINEKPSPLSVFAGIGTFVGLLLLGLAGVSVVSSNTPVLKGAAVEASRRLQMMGYITTTDLPSSFDSSDSSSLGSSFDPSKSIDSLSSGSLPSLDLRVFWDQITRTTDTVWLTVTVTLVLQALFAVIYYHKVVKGYFGDETILQKEKSHDHSNQTRPGEFDQSIFECTSNKWVFCHGLCCPMVRQAHTNQVAGVCGFWESLCCWCCCSWFTLGLGPSCLVIFWRVSIKQTLSAPGQPAENLVEDFCISGLCPELSVCQMATSVDKEMQSEMTGCCNFRNSEGYPHDGF